MRALWLGVALTALSQTAGADDSLRCGSRLVRTGAPAAEVLGACGEPAYRDPWVIHRRGYGDVSDTQEWYYNFGSTRLLRVLRLRDGRLVDVGEDGYGFDEPPRGDCRPADIIEGMSKYRLLLQCGTPATRETFSLWEPLRRPDGRVVPGRFADVFRERWVYDFGPDLLQHIVTLRNGRVTDVTTGDRGTGRGDDAAPH